MDEVEPGNVQVLDRDQELAARLQRGDARAVEALFDRYGRLAYGLAYRMLSDAGGAEEVVQEAFLLIWQNAARFDASRGSLRTWLLAIVRHKAVDRLRRSRARPQTSLEMVDQALVGPDLWEAVSSSLSRQDVRRAFAGLPEAQRQTIELAYFGGFSQTEIAERMNVPLGTVKGRMRIGLEKMRSFLQGRGLEG
jgi:RNA polymerase sigma-70 factor (ECF subfamily)